ncbi:hypothetical protein VNI00_012852 [Paramarasmius palmivorus]|uniref:Uncharacterized protein n=1 Tax=Paramarasmius palmivorus TaxID=297713 RepID=A0AAW0BZY0_9AGAR
MHPSEVFHGLNEAKYREKISNPQYELDTIKANITKKRRTIAASRVQVVVGVAAAGVSGGASLFGTAYSARNIDIEKQKLQLLEEELERRGQERLPRHLIADTIVPGVIAGTVGALALSVDSMGLSNAITPTPGDLSNSSYNPQLVTACTLVVVQGAEMIAEEVVVDRAIQKFGKKPPMGVMNRQFLETGATDTVVLCVLIILGLY